MAANNPVVQKCSMVEFPVRKDSEDIQALRNTTRQFHAQVDDLINTIRTFKRDSAVLSGMCKILNDAVLRISVKGVVEDINQSAEKLFRVDNSVCGNTFFFLTGVVFSEFLETLPENGKAQLKMANSSGETFDASVSVTEIIHDEGEAEYICIIRDITDILRMKSALIASDNKFDVLSKALDESTDVVMITDKNNEIIFVNRAFEQHTGYDRVDALGKNPKFLASGLIANDIYSDMWENLRSGKVWSGELINVAKDGSLLYDETYIFPVVIGNKKNNVPSYYIGVKYVSG